MSDICYIMGRRDVRYLNIFATLEISTFKPIESATVILAIMAHTNQNHDSIVIFTIPL